MIKSILVVEDDTVQRKMAETIVSRRMGCAVLTAKNGQEAVDIIKASEPDEISAVLLDIEMPVMNGFEALKAIKALSPDLPVIMLTAASDASVAVKAIKDGASDFVVKPPEPAHLEVTINNAVKMRKMAQEITRMKRDKEGALMFSDLIGHDGGLQQSVSFGKKAAASEVPVLITGETGSGKELFARAIHGESRRVGAPFIAINCGAIPENLVESILFGHEKGSFTGALNRSIGKFREAEGGTIFLDEVGELPLEAQVKLLRVLQQQEVEPVGAGRAVKVNVRIISATNRDLKLEVREGRFREDLYFRLNVLPIHVPPLRNRKSDIMQLVDYFIEKFAAQDMLNPKAVGPDTKAYLEQHGWPGNVRELENLIRRALVLCEGDVISREQLGSLHEDYAGSGRSITENTDSNLGGGLHISLTKPDGKFKTMEEIEGEAMAIALSHFDSNITRTSEALSIAKSTFYRKIKSA